MAPPVRFAPASLLVLSLLAASCSARDGGDPHSDQGVPAVGGKDLRIRDVSDPTRPEHPTYVSGTPAVSGVIVTAVDTYDETRDGKGTGTLYVQDIGPGQPYSGISLFATTFNPGNLRVSVGDVLDLKGTYQEATNRGPTAMFPPGSVQAQIAFAVASFRYETAQPVPVDIPLADLNDFAKARQWIGLLVRVKDVPFPRETYTATSGRSSVDMGTLPQAGAGCDSAFPKAPQLVNDLMDLTPLNLQPGSTLKSVVGVVGFFCAVHLAPRSLADIQP
jgi:hypothetical protein